MTDLDRKPNMSSTINGSGENEAATSRFGPAAETASDLATEKSGKEILPPTSSVNQPADVKKENHPEAFAPTLDPICNMAVDPSSALRVERDGKSFYFCSDRCRLSFLDTIAGVKSDSKSGSCCG